MKGFAGEPFFEKRGSPAPLPKNFSKKEKALADFCGGRFINAFKVFEEGAGETFCKKSLPRHSFQKSLKQPRDFPIVINVEALGGGRFLKHIDSGRSAATASGIRSVPA